MSDNTTRLTPSGDDWWDGSTSLLGEYMDAWQRDHAYAAVGRLVVEELELLRNMQEYFDDRADAECFTDRAAPVGNEEMGFLVFLRRIIAAADSLATTVEADDTQ